MALLFGGLFVPPDNIKDDQAFEYMLEAVEGEIYGIELYPEISTKAAIYLHNITCNHIFNDGTKRTGLAAALLFLEKKTLYLSLASLISNKSIL
jgi:death-on-curing protein